MAGNIRGFESPIDKLTPTNVGAEAYEMEGRHVEAAYGAAGSYIGRGMATLGNQLEEHDTMVQTGDLMKNMSDLEINAHDAMMQARTTMDPDDPDAANKFMAGFDEQMQAIDSKTYTPKVREMADRMLADFKTRTQNNFVTYQADAQANKFMANLNQTTDTMSNLANRDPTFVDIGANAIKMAADSIPSEHRDEYIKQHTNALYDSAAEGMTSRVEGMKQFDPKAVAGIQGFLTDPKNGYVDNMSSGKFASIMNRLDNLRRSGGNQTIAGMELNKGPMLSQMSLTGIDPGNQLATMSSNLRAVGTPEANAKADELDQSMMNAKGEYGARQIVNRTPADKLAMAGDQLTNEVRNTGLTGSQIAVVNATKENFDKVRKEREAAFSGADPAKQGQWEIDNNDGVRSAYDAWIQNPTAENFLTYYQKSYGEQRFLEPGKLPSVVTEKIADDAKAAVNMIEHDPKAGPIAAAQSLAKQADMYGAAWPQIVGDLAKKKVLNGDQFIAASLIGDPHAARWGETLLRASTMTDKDREGLHGISESKAAEMVRGPIQSLVASMGNINNANELVSTYIKSASHIIQATGMQDANDLVKTMFLDRYQFTGNGGSIRLPAGMPDADAIGDGSSNVLHDIGNHDLVIPETTRLGSINQKEAWVDAIKANGVWNTAGDGHSAILYDGIGNQVMERRNGKIVPVQLDFAELARLGKGQPISREQLDAEEKLAK